MAAAFASSKSGKQVDRAKRAGTDSRRHIRVRGGFDAEQWSRLFQICSFVGYAHIEVDADIIPFDTCTSLPSRPHGGRDIDICMERVRRLPGLARPGHIFLLFRDTRSNHHNFICGFGSCSDMVKPTTPGRTQVVDDQPGLTLYAMYASSGAVVDNECAPHAVVGLRMCSWATRVNGAPVPA